MTILAEAPAQARRIIELAFLIDLLSELSETTHDRMARQCLREAAAAVSDAERALQDAEAVHLPPIKRWGRA